MSTSTHQKVAWLEGEGLRAEHLRQQERYIDYLFSHCHGRFAPYHWGVSRLSMNTDFLKVGKIALTGCRGVLPDGTVFDIPHQDAAPIPIDIKEDTVNTVVYLALPLAHSHRYHVDMIETRNNSGLPTTIPIGRLRLQLMLEKEFKQGFCGIAIARILEARTGQETILDPHFLPTCLDVQAIPALKDLVIEIHSLLRVRGDKLIERVSGSTGSVAEITDVLLLQLINRTEPLFALMQEGPLHPQSFYRALVQLMGELATFTDANRRPMLTVKYQHSALRETFEPVRHQLRKALSSVLEENAVSIALEDRGNGIWVGLILDKQLLSSAEFILAIHADISPDTLRQTCLAQIKVAPVEEIRTLVNRALPGIPLHVMSVPPRQIAYHSDFVYFSLDRHAELWKQAANSTGLAFHISGLFPGFKMECWAVK